MYALLHHLTQFLYAKMFRTLWYWIKNCWNVIRSLFSIIKRYDCEYLALISSWWRFQNGFVIWYSFLIKDIPFCVKSIDRTPNETHTHTHSMGKRQNRFEPKRGNAIFRHCGCCWVMDHAQCQIKSNIKMLWERIVNCT